ncbi:MAG: alpha/beta hydrolase [Gemmatimonadetes bacterium]|nr:alpha/beta hydrolase [Gemmatimonadota bacterium]
MIHMGLIGGAFGFTMTVPVAMAAQVRVVKDIDYVPGAEYADGKDRLDVFVPPEAKSAPVMVSFYGGALHDGDKSEQSYIGQRFAGAGYVTVVANYRHSPGVQHPAHVQDAAAAVAWVKKNIAQYGGDPSKIFLTGHSAGAYLLTLLMLDPTYLAAHGMKPADIRGGAPVSAFFYVERTGVAPDRPKDTWGTDPTKWKSASPASYVRANVPPLLLLYADGDDAWRRQQQSDFAADLRAAGDKDVATQMISGRNHLTVWYNIEKGEEETSRAIVAFVEKVLKR